MDRKFFVTVIAPDRPALVGLRRYDLDLFHQTAQATSTRAVALRATRDRSGARTYEETAKVNETREFVIDGLLSLTEVGRLVDDGYQVLLKENDARKARARTEVIEFEEWLRGMPWRRRVSSSPPTLKRSTSWQKARSQYSSSA